MKLLSIRTARTIWLVPPTYINPRGRFILPGILACAKRYGFVKVPNPQSFFETPVKVMFEGGSFTASDGVSVVVNLTLHDDGIVADTRSSTEDSELFLEDALGWLATEFQLPEPSELSIKKIYLSEVNLAFDRSIEIFNDRFSNFVRSLRSGVGTNPAKPMELVNLNFGTDPGTGARQALLRIERDVGASFNENRYFSSALLQTSEHLKLLREFEEAAGATSGR
jgi:hypothetical protein